MEIIFKLNLKTQCKHNFFLNTIVYILQPYRGYSYIVIFFKYHIDVFNYQYRPALARYTVEKKI